MILGIGTDLVKIPRVERLLMRFGDRFTHRCFTERERMISDKSKCPASSYAKRFAAKEACSKALGIGIASGIHWLDFETTNDAFGKPGMEFSGKASSYLSRMVPCYSVSQVDLSLADEYPFAQAVVVISARPFLAS